VKIFILMCPALPPAFFTTAAENCIGPSGRPDVNEQVAPQFTQSVSVGAL
jgi:hypothetical protein